MNTETHSKIDHQKIDAEIAKLIGETSKLNKDLKWYEVGVIVAATLVVVAVVKLFLI